MTDGALQSGEGLVVVVYRVDAVTLGLLVRRARLGKVDVRSRSDSVPILNQLELLLRLFGVLLLERDCFLSGFQRQIRRGDGSRQSQLPGLHLVTGVRAVGHSFL